MGESEKDEAGERRREPERRGKNGGIAPMRTQNANHHIHAYPFLIIQMIPGGVPPPTADFFECEYTQSVQMRTDNSC